MLRKLKFIFNIRCIINHCSSTSICFL